MADYALFCGWDRPIAGREADAVELFNQWVGFLTNQQKAGNIESFEPVLIMPHGGDLNGFTLIRGDRMKLDALVAKEEFKELSARASHMVGGWGVTQAVINQELASEFTRYGKIIRK